MNNPLKIPLERLEATVQSIKPRLIDAIGVEGLKFIDDNFSRQGFQGVTFHPWPIQQNPNKPRPHKVLILTANAPAAALPGTNATALMPQPFLPIRLMRCKIHNDGGDIQ